MWYRVGMASMVCGVVVVAVVVYVKKTVSLCNNPSYHLCNR